MSIESTLEERGSRYGKFVDHAVIAQRLQDGMRTAPNWLALEPDMKQALTVIADKIARILNGDARYPDNWHDIAGYATLVDKRLVEEQKPALFEKLIPVYNTTVDMGTITSNNTTASLRQGIARAIEAYKNTEI